MHVYSPTYMYLSPCLPRGRLEERQENKEEGGGRGLQLEGQNITKCNGDG